MLRVSFFARAGVALARVVLFCLLEICFILKVVFDGGLVGREGSSFRECVLIREFIVYDVSLLVVALLCA